MLTSSPLARASARERRLDRRRAAFALGLTLALALTSCGKRDDRPAPTAAAAPHAAAPATPAAAAAADTPPTAVTLPPAPPLPPLPLGLPQPPPPEVEITAERVALGALLFSEARWSADGKTSCAGCHRPEAGYSGGREPTALGRPNLRRAPALVNVAWQRELGWDGRFPSLLGHLGAHLHGQLGVEPDDASSRVAQDPVVRAHFARATGGPPSSAAALAALSAFVLTRYSGGAPWDEEEERAAASERGKTLRAGYALFRGKAQCAVCHPPPLYTDLAYHRLGLIASADEGRGRSDPAARGAFKTPTLRGAALRPRLFHDASATTLTGAIDWHLAGGVGQGADRSIVDPAMPPIALSPAERAELVAFVEALSHAPPPPEAK